MPRFMLKNRGTQAEEMDDSTSINTEQKQELLDEANEGNFKVQKLKIYEDIMQLLASISAVQIPEVVPPELKK